LAGANTVAVMIKLIKKNNYNKINSH